MTPRKYAADLFRAPTATPATASAPVASAPVALAAPPADEKISVESDSNSQIYSKINFYEWLVFNYPDGGLVFESPELPHWDRVRVWREHGYRLGLRGQQHLQPPAASQGRRLDEALECSATSDAETIERHRTAFDRPPAPCSNLVASPAGEAEACGCPVYWLNPQMHVHCEACHPPPSGSLGKAIIRGRFMVVCLRQPVDGGEAGWAWERLKQKP